MSATIKRTLTAFVLTLVLYPTSVFAFAINPTSADDAIEPGDTATRSFQIANTDKVEHEYRADLLRVNFGDQDGEMSFSELDSDIAGSISVSPATMILGPNQVGTITVKLSTDVNTRARVIPLGLRVVMTASEHSDVTVEEGIIGLWFVTVGTPLEGFVVQDFSMPQTFLAHLPAVWHVAVRNTGQSVFVPEGEIRINNLVGGTIEVLPLNPDGKRIPPGQTRTLRVTWEQGALAGAFKATAVVDDQVKTLDFYVLPYRTVLTLAGLSLLAVLLLRQSRRRVR